MRRRLLRTCVCAAVAALVGFEAASPAAQVAARRAASLAALLTYPGFFQGQLVVVRGTLTTRDHPVLLSPSADRSVPLIFKGPSPVDGPVELRASFWDVGRLQRDDPRIASLGLDRLLPRAPDADWPKPGEVVALTVTDAMAVKPAGDTPSLRELALDPSRSIGERVKIMGQFRGRNLYGELPQGPGLSQWDFVLRAADAAIWVTGIRPRGRGFNLSTSARADTNTWLEVTGVVREAKGLVWLEGQQLALGKPDVEIRNAETPPVPQMGPPPDVIFSDPTEGELDVPLTSSIRLQFSRDMNPDSFKGRVRWAVLTPEALASGNAASVAATAQAVYKYDRAKRSLEVQLGAPPVPYQNIVVELAEVIAAIDGVAMKPWLLMFSFGAK